MKYIVYLTTNLKSRINGVNRIYVGVHSTQDPGVFDKYLGDGVYTDQPASFMYPKTPFQCAVKKYGVESFIRSVLYICDTLEEAMVKMSTLLTKDFIDQSHVYNVHSDGSIDAPIYQYNMDGVRIKQWDNYESLLDFYGYPEARFISAIRNKQVLLNSYWSNSDTLDMRDCSIHQAQVIYLYNLDGKCVRIFPSKKACAEFLGVDEVKEDTLLLKKYYISPSVTDEFKVKPRRMYLHKSLHIYDSTGKYYGYFKGKEIMKVIDLHSWAKISRIFTHNEGWYKDFYLSDVEVPEVPPKRVLGLSVDVYTNTGEFIETLRSVNAVRLKYNVPMSKMKDIQKGNKYFENYVFKYHSPVRSK